MQDAVPRIFRSLEKQAGRDGFDTIVTAAVASFAAHRNPTERQALEFGRLVAPAWDKIDAKTQRALAAALSRSPRVPRTVVEKLLAAPIDTAAPFLMASPCLTPEDLQTLADEANPKLQRILARRLAGEHMLPPSSEETCPAPPAPKLVVPATTPADEPVDAVGNAPILPPPSPVREAPKVTQARAALLRLAEPGRHAAEPIDDTPTSLSAILHAARLGQATRAYDGLTASLELSEARARDMVGDPSGEILASALKAMQAGPADALTILMLLKPRIGLHVEAFEAMKSVYRDLDVAQCRMRLGLSSASPSRHAPRFHPQSAALEPRSNAGTARRVFGRRRALPTQSERSSGGS